jgi:hypothetical protein
MVTRCGHAADRSAGVIPIGWWVQVVRAIGDELRGFKVGGLHLERTWRQKKMGVASGYGGYHPNHRNI